MPAAGAVALYFGAPAATAATVTAVATAVAYGALAGAVIGAATAAMTGGDVMKGALKGALIGGVTAGVFKYGSIAMAGEAGAEGVVAADAAAPSASAAVETTPPAFDTSTFATPPAAASPTIGPVNMPAQGSGILASQTPVVQPPAKSPLIGKEATNSILAGTGQGVGMGVALVGQEMMKGDTDKEIAEYQAQVDQQRIAGNVPGIFNRATISSKLPNWWDEHLNPNAAPTI